MSWHIRVTDVLAHVTYAYLHYCALIVARHFALYFLKEAPGQLHLNWVYEECRKSTFCTQRQINRLHSSK